MDEPAAHLEASLGGRYAILREIGRGATAVVYLADDRKHGRKVAIKVLRPGLPSDVDVQRFLREIEIAAQLTHPHIVPLHDSGHVEEFFYYVMPYIAGDSLRVRLRREGRLPIPEALQITRHVADALAHAHLQGVIHRDIKPENILLTPGGAMVTDFGIARALSAAGRDTLTETGFTLGTPAYMSPEQSSGTERVDGRADIYSLGCVAYEMLACQPPFSGASRQVILLKHYSATPPSIRDERPEVPEWLEEVILTCLAKAPRNRYQTASDLAQVLKSRPDPYLASSPDGARDEAPPLWRRLAWTYPVAAVLVLGAGLWALRPPASESADVSPGMSAPAEADRGSVAVLPLESLDATSENDFFSAGISDDILTALSKVSGLRVIGRISIARLAATLEDPQQIGQALGVAAVLHGSVQREMSEVRIRVHLTDVRTGEVLWSDSYDRELGDIFAIQTDIANQVARALDAEMSIGERDRIARVPTRSLSAYDLYLKGRDHFFRATPEDIERAIGLFRESLQLDGGFALAHAGLADGFVGRVIFGAEPVWLDSALAAANRALELQPGLAEAYGARGLAHLYARRPREALTDYTEALRLAPNNGFLLTGMAAIQDMLGNLDEVLRWGRRAVAVEPTSGRTRLHVGYALTEFDRLSEAEAWFRDILRIEPDLDWAHAWLGHVAQRSGASPEDVVARLEQILDSPEASPGVRKFAGRVALASGDLELAGRFLEEAAAAGYDGEGLATIDLAYVRRRQGRADESRALLERAERSLLDRREGGERTWELHHDLARIHGARGEEDAALAALEQAFELGWSAFFWRGTDPLLASLRSNPRYQDLLERGAERREEMSRRARPEA